MVVSRIELTRTCRPRNCHLATAVKRIHTFYAVQFVGDKLTQTPFIKKNLHEVV